MSRKKEAFEIIDPNRQRAVDMVKELRNYSPHNQAIAIINVRKKDPQLASMIVSILKGSTNVETENGST